MENEEALLDSVAPAHNIAPWSWAAGTPLVQFLSMGSFLICFCIMICAFIVIGGSGGGTSGPMPANYWTLSVNSCRASTSTFPGKPLRMGGTIR